MVECLKPCPALQKFQIQCNVIVKSFAPVQSVTNLLKRTVAATLYAVFVDKHSVGYVEEPLDGSTHGPVSLVTLVAATKKKRRMLNVQRGTSIVTCTITSATKPIPILLSLK